MTLAQGVGMTGPTDATAETFGVSPLNGSTADMEHVEASFLCADVVRFTAMTQRLGDHTSLRLMRRVARLVQAEAASRQGRVVEVRGDSFLVALSCSELSVECALAIHTVLAHDAAHHPDGGVDVRMAIHTGHVIQMRDQYFGLNVILPYRMLPKVSAGQIAITDAARARIGSEALDLVGERRSFHPKGFQEDVAFTVLETRERIAVRGIRRSRTTDHSHDQVAGAQVALRAS